MNRSKADVVQLPNREQMREDASLWIVRLDRGLTDAERAELDEWLAGDSRRLEALAKLAVLWDEADLLAKYPEVFADSRPTHAITTAAPKVARARWWLAAAVVAGVGVAVGLLSSRMFGEDAPVVAQLPLVYETAVGEHSTIRLPDGSTVALNTDSAIEVQYEEAQRSIFLRRGEGFFDVAHDPRRPFRVHAGTRMMEALGTAFNVRLMSASDIKLVVTEGKVRVLPREAPAAPAAASPSERVPDAIVEAGSLAILDEGPVVVQGLDVAEIETRLSWQRGMLVFDDEPLEAVLREITRYTTVELVLDDSIRGVKIGGYFRTGDVDEFLTALRDGLDIDSRRDEQGRIVLIPSAHVR